MKYSEWLQEWMSNYVQTTAKQKTAIKYTGIISNQICPKFGNEDMENLTTINLQKFITELLTSGNSVSGKGLSSSAVNSVITVLHSSLSTAYDLGLIPNNPAIKLKRPKSTERKTECFSMEEQKKIEKAVTESKHGYMFGIVICLYTGLRIGELLALEWGDIDFSNGILTVAKTCFDGKNKNGVFGRIISYPKTESSHRAIPIPKQLTPMLRELKKQSDCKYVIAKKGKPMLVRTYQRNFTALLKRLHIPHKCFHALRHTFATRATECGIDVKTISEILGHKNSTITLNRYSHSLIWHKKEAMNKLGKLF